MPNSSSDIPPGRMIFLVMTAEGGKAMATFLVRLPLFLTARRTSICNFFKLLNVAIGNPTALQWLDRAMLKDQTTDFVMAQLDQLDTGRTDVQPEQRRGLSTKQGPQRDQNCPLKPVCEQLEKQK